MNAASQIVASSALYVAWRGLAAASVHLEASDSRAAVLALESVALEIARARAAIVTCEVVAVPVLRPSTR